MQIKDRVMIRIDSVAFGGDGVGRLDNIVVFVPFSAPGDELEIEITQLKKSFARGRILQVVKPSPLRAEPRCRYYGKCGGCSYQHLDYPYQLESKKKQVEESFWKIGKISNPRVFDVIPSPQIYHYRGRAQYHTRAVSHEREIGFMDVSGGRLLDIEHCEIMDETINEKLHAIRKEKGLLSDENDLIIWSDFLSGEENESITRIVKGKNFQVPRDGFFQANLYLTDKLVDEVCRLIEPEKVNTLIDAYCGSALFSVFLSPYVGKVIGIEINEKSVRCAQVNASQAGVRNAEFIQGDVEKILQEKLLPVDNADLIVLDPPRTGCEKAVLKAMVDLQPIKIIYISCNPATQARDVKYLNEFGYNLMSLLPLDMFPQTSHIEVIGLLEKR